MRLRKRPDYKINKYIRLPNHFENKSGIYIAYYEALNACEEYVPFCLYVGKSIKLTHRVNTLFYQKRQNNLLWVITDLLIKADYRNFYINIFLYPEKQLSEIESKYIKELRPLCNIRR